MTVRPPTLERTAPEDPSSPEVLFREARRRRRRRYGLGALMTSAAVGLVVGLLGSSSSLPPPRPPVQQSTPPSADGYSVSTRNGATVRSISLADISPQDIVSLDGKIWLVGLSSSSSTTNPTATLCSAEEVDPATLQRVRRYALEACGDYVVGGRGDIFLAVITYISPSNTQSVRIERFDPATGRSIVLAPVDLTVSGSSRAHCELAYVDGQLWFWGSGTPGTPSDSLVEISPSTGAVLDTFPSTVLPSPGIPRNLLTGQGDDLWIVGAGADDHEEVEVLGPGQSAPSVVTTAGELVQWMAAVDGGVWAYAYTVHTTPSNPAKETSTNRRLLRLDAQGVVKTIDSPTLAGEGTVGSEASLLVSGVARRCDGPMRVWQVDASSGKVTPLVAVHTPYETCLGSTGLASADDAAFTFLADQGYPARLYRVRNHVG